MTTPKMPSVKAAQPPAPIFSPAAPLLAPAPPPPVAPAPVPPPMALSQGSSFKTQVCSVVTETVSAYVVSSGYHKLCVCVKFSSLSLQGCFRKTVKHIERKVLERIKRFYPNGKCVVVHEVNLKLTYECKSHPTWMLCLFLQIRDEWGNTVWICPGCNKPDDGSPMIGCDDCDDWYHW